MHEKLKGDHNSWIISVFHLKEKLLKFLLITLLAEHGV